MAAGKLNSAADQNIARLRAVSNVQTHLMSRQREEEQPQVQLHAIDVVFMLLSLVTFVADLVTDIVVAAQYFSDGSVVWGSLTLTFIVVPMVILQIFSLSWYQSDAIYSRPLLYTIHSLLLGPFFRYLLVLKNAFKAWKTRGEDDISRFYQQQNDLCILRLFESFLESAPQVLLQLYIMLRTQDANWLTTCSAVISILSLAWCVAAYTNAMRLATCEDYSMSCTGLSVLSLWRLFMLTSRIITLVIFTAAFQAWIFLVVGIHWLGMFVWISLQRTSFCSNWITERLYNGIVAVIYCFCFFNVADGRTRWRVVGFYAIMIVENTLLLVVWFAMATPIPWKMWTTVAGVYGSFILGLLCMLAYYRFCHPSMASSSKNGRESVYMTRAQFKVWRNNGLDEYSVQFIEDGHQANNQGCEDYLEPISHNNVDVLECEPIDLSAYSNSYSATRKPLLEKFLRSRIKRSASRDDDESEQCLQGEDYDGAVGGSDEGSHIECVRNVNSCDEFERVSYQQCHSDNVSLGSDDIQEMKLKCDPDYQTDLQTGQPHGQPHYFELEQEHLIPKMDLRDLLVYGTDTSDLDINSSTDLNSSFLSINPPDSLQKSSSENLDNNNQEMRDYASFLANSLPLDGFESTDDNSQSESGASGSNVTHTKNAVFEDHSSIDSFLDDKDLNNELSGSSDLTLAREIYKTQQNNYVFI